MFYKVEEVLSKVRYNEENEDSYEVARRALNAINMDFSLLSLEKRIIDFQDETYNRENPKQKNEFMLFDNNTQNKTFIHTVLLIEIDTVEYIFDPLLGDRYHLYISSKGERVPSHLLSYHRYVTLLEEINKDNTKLELVSKRR